MHWLQICLAVFPAAPSPATQYSEPKFQFSPTKMNGSLFRKSSTNMSRLQSRMVRTSLTVGPAKSLIYAFIYQNLMIMLHAGSTDYMFSFHKVVCTAHSCYFFSLWCCIVTLFIRSWFKFYNGFIPHMSDLDDLCSWQIWSSEDTALWFYHEREFCFILCIATLVVYTTTLPHTYEFPV